jgi:23S rRNA pseudouridine955/2504/2580 synthase
MNDTKNQGHSKVEHVIVAADYDGQRIDNFLLRHLKGVPKSMIYRILRKGEVRVNKGRIKPQYRLKTGDDVRIPPINRSQSTPVNPSESAIASIQDCVLYEDERILVINKPSGMAVHGGSGVSFGVIEAVRRWRSDLHYLELVHRLDRETSGCLILAKKRSALRHLHELLRENRIEKRYLALLKGNWQYGERTVDVPLQKNTLRSGERVVRVSEHGKTAISIFKPIAITKTASLLEVQIKTGRTHQIRVHAAYTGHPVAGDEKYGDRSFNRQLASMGLSRMFLHARGLAFSMEEPHKDIVINAPLDAELDEILKKLSINA